MLGLKNFPFFDVKAFVTCINPQTTPHLSFAVRYLCAVNLPSSQEICLQDKRTATEVDGCLDKMPLKELGKKKTEGRLFYSAKSNRKNTKSCLMQKLYKSKIKYPNTFFLSAIS